MKMKTIEEYAKLGEQYSTMEALILLTKAYIEMCGYSLSYRTVVYCAGEAWQERLAWQDLPLSEMARKEPFVTLMPYITSEYEPDLYDDYDITGMNNEELVNACKQAIMETIFDESTIEVLCWGISKATEEKKILSQVIEATAHDGTSLKGILTEQSCAATTVTMIFPYNNLCASTIELVRDAKELLVKTYEDCQRLHKIESEIRGLYPNYQEELRKSKNESSWKKYMVFRKVYGTLVDDDTVIVSPEKWLYEWFGLEFYDDNTNKDPTWL